MVCEALRAAGHRTGLYTSPHLVDVRERMIVDGQPITEQAFAMWTERLLPVIEASGASFFEATTAIAFADFAARGVELAVVEVGLGGRLDATNVLDPLVSAVTNVAREHTDYLGDELEGIAREKAGIAKRGRPFVVGEGNSELADVLVVTALEAGAIPVTVPPDAVYPAALGLRGPHQRRNAAIAKAVLEAVAESVAVPDVALERGFRVAHLPARLERCGRWVFDVAHNAAATEALVRALGADPPPEPLHALVGILRDKDWPTMLRLLGQLVDRMWLTVAPSAPAERRWDVYVAAGECGRNTVAAPDFDLALERVQEGAATVLVTGSFYTVGDALVRLPGFRPLG